MPQAPGPIVCFLFSMLAGHTIPTSHTQAHSHAAPRLHLSPLSKKFKYLTCHPLKTSFCSLLFIPSRSLPDISKIYPQLVFSSDLTLKHTQIIHILSLTHTHHNVRH